MVRHQSSETAVMSKPTKRVETQSSKSITNAALPESDDNLAPSERIRKSLAFKVHQVRSYDGTAPSAAVKVSPLSPIYRPRNFLIDDAGVLTQKNAMLKPKVQLTKVNITRYHINAVKLKHEP